MELHSNMTGSIIAYQISQESKDNISKECENLQLSLPKAKGLTNDPVLLYQEFWLPSHYLHSTILLQRHFQARDNDIILASYPKSGTTWLKALIFSTVNRTKYDSISNISPLFSCNPHELVPSLELNYYSTHHDLVETFPSPRTLASHLPYASLPESVKTCNCKIVYVCRNPLDVFVSFWKFYQNFKPEGRLDWTLNEFFEAFSEKDFLYGPYWEHVLRYWKMSLEMPNKVLFLKYEDMKKDCVGELKKLAEFVGVPFSLEEEKDGVIESISKLCSLGSLKDMEVNKNGSYYPEVDNKSLFRKGEVGDWVNHLSPSMAQQLENIMKEKWSPSGLVYQVSLNDNTKMD